VNYFFLKNNLPDPSSSPPSVLPASAVSLFFNCCKERNENKGTTDYAAQPKAAVKKIFLATEDTENTEK
jgi:hypothetical protein